MAVQREQALAACLGMPGAREDYPFGDEVAVCKVAGKMFALVPLGAEPGSVSLKCDPDRAAWLRRQYAAVTAGYHLNKRHWNTIELDGSVPDDELLDLIGHSYELVVARLPRAVRAGLNRLLSGTDRGYCLAVTLPATYAGGVNAIHLGLAVGGGLGLAGVVWALAIIVAHLRAGRVHPPPLSTLAHRHHRARQLAVAGDHAAAERHFRHLRTAQRRVHGTDHITTVHTQHQLARSLARQGKYREAEQEYRASLAARVRLVGPDHMSVFVARLQVAKMVLLQGRLRQAEAEYRSLLADQTRVLGPDHPDTVFTRDALGALTRAKRHTA